ADLIALVPGAIDQKLQRARGLAARDPERRDKLFLRQTEKLSRRGSSTIGTGGGGRMETAGIVRGWIEGVAEPAAHLGTGADGRQHIAARGTDQFADGESRRNHRRTGMQRGIGVGIVK